MDQTVYLNDFLDQSKDSKSWNIKNEDGLTEIQKRNVIDLSTIKNSWSLDSENKELRQDQIYLVKNLHSCSKFIDYINQETEALNGVLKIVDNDLKLITRTFEKSKEKISQKIEELKQLKQKVLNSINDDQRMNFIRVARLQNLKDIAFSNNRDLIDKAAETFLRRNDSIYSKFIQFDFLSQINEFPQIGQKEQLKTHKDFILESIKSYFDNLIEYDLDRKFQVPETLSRQIFKNYNNQFAFEDSHINSQNQPAYIESERLPVAQQISLALKVTSTDLNTKWSREDLQFKLGTSFTDAIGVDSSRINFDPEQGVQFKLDLSNEQLMSLLKTSNLVQANEMETLRLFIVFKRNQSIQITKFFINYHPTFYKKQLGQSTISQN